MQNDNDSWPKQPEVPSNPPNPYAAPAASAQPQYTQQPTMPVQPAPQAVAPQPHRSKLKPLIIAIAGIVVIGLAVLALFVAPGLFNKSQPAAPSASGPQPAAIIPDASDLTAAKLAAINKDDLFWAYFSYAAQQQHVATTHTEQTSPDTSKPSLTLTYVVATDFDYKTKAYSVAKDFIAAPNSYLNSMTRCVNGEAQVRYPKLVVSGTSVDRSQWQKMPEGCQLSAYTPYLTDGFSISGLSADQTKQYVDFLRAQGELISIASAKLEDHKGKQYIHFSVATAPIRVEDAEPGEDLYQGNEWFYYGLDAIGVDERAHPYALKSAYGDGFAIDYYIDPQKKLPAYVEVSDTPAYDNNGKPRAQVGQDTMKTLIQFEPSRFDFSEANKDWIPFDW